MKKKLCSKYLVAGISLAGGTVMIEPRDATSRFYLISWIGLPFMDLRWFCGQVPYFMVTLKTSSMVVTPFRSF